MKKYGDDCKKDPPVPIPNTDVKLLSAEDSEGFAFVKAGRCRSFFNLYELNRNIIIPQ